MLAIKGPAQPKKRTKARINREKKRSCGRKIKYMEFVVADNAAKILMMRDGGIVRRTFVIFAAFGT